MHRSLHLPIQLLSMTVLLSFYMAFSCYTPREVGDSWSSLLSGGGPYGSGGYLYALGGGAYGYVYGGSDPYGSGGHLYGSGGYTYSDCEPSEARVAYEVWSGSANDFGAFAGTSWVVEETLLVLVISNDVAYLQNGDYVAPASGQGYLEPQEPESAYGTAFPWVEGGRYELRGVTPNEDGIHFGDLPTSAAHGDWCRMQMPYPVPDTLPCVFASYPGPAHVPSCTAAHAPVDCWWLRVNQSGVCACDFQGCFPSVRRAYTIYELQINFLSEDEAVMLLVGPKQGTGDPIPDPLLINPPIEYRLVRD